MTTERLDHTAALTVDALDHLVLNVRDVETTIEWYERVLGMRHDIVRTPAGATRAMLRFGRQKINVRPVEANAIDWFTAASPAAGSADLCFLTQMPPQAVAGHFRAHGVEIEAGPVEKPGAMGTIVSVYCRDPDGNLIEVSSYAGERRT